MNKFNKKIISVDAGRSSVKSATLKGNYIQRNLFDAKLGFANFSYLKTLSAISFDSSKDIICSVNDSKPIIVGGTCDMLLPPERVIYATSDEVYLEYAVKYILIAVAKFVDNNDSVTLAINLTYNNMNYTDKIKDVIKGKHIIKFYDTKKNITKEKTFTIDKLAVFYQGWTTVMYKAIKEDLTFDDSYLRDGIIIDIGRKTTDVALVRKLASAKGYSYEIATEDIFICIKETLYEEYMIRKDTKDIERLVMDDGEIMSRNGKIVKLREHLEEAISITVEQIRNSILEDFGNYTPYWCILTGGGTVWFNEYLKNLFNNLITADEFIFSNCLGMINMLRKFEK